MSSKIEDLQVLRDLKADADQLGETLDDVSLAELAALEQEFAAPAVERQDEPVAPFDAKRALTQALSAYEAMTGRHLMPAGISEHQDQFICGFLARAAEQPAPVSVVLPRYTCIGKGGEYERLGYAKPSGALRTIQGESGVIVYRDTATGKLYFRDPADFQQRMDCIDKVKELNP